MRFEHDPKGFFVIHIDKKKNKKIVEHFDNVKKANSVVTGKLTKIFEGTDAEEISKKITEEGLVSQLSHAAYLGRELQRAETALRIDAEYVQE